jgi:hypothetical protein
MRCVFAGPVLLSLALVSAATAQTPVDPHPEDAPRAILAAFDTYRAVGIPAAHRMKDLDDFILSLIRNPALPNAVNDVVVECGNSLYQQPELDRYIAGGNVPLSEARQAWRNTTQPMCGVSAFYEELFPLVRQINRKLPPGKRLRVLAGDPPIDWRTVRSQADVRSFPGRRDDSMAAVVEKEVFAKHRKALLLYGTAHLIHGSETGVGLFEKDYPGATFVIDVYYKPGCETPSAADDAALEARMTLWPVPSLARTKGNALTNRAKTEYSVLLTPNGRSSDPVDAYLYLGPQALMLSEPRPADVFVDREFMAELHRRAELMPGSVNDQVDPGKVREQDADPLLCGPDRR